MWDTWNVTYHHTSQPTFKTTHSINIDLMVGLFLFGGFTHLSIIQWLTKYIQDKNKNKNKNKKIHDRLIVN